MGHPVGEAANDDTCLPFVKDAANAHGRDDNRPTGPPRAVRLDEQ
jgi:hypothetical protein